MKATMFATARYTLAFKQEEIQILLLCSVLHYDSTCREASQVGGFLYGWTNCRIQIDDETDHIDPTYMVNCNSREIQICLKILELPPGGVDSVVVRHLNQVLRSCLHEADRELSQLTWEIDG